MALPDAAHDNVMFVGPRGREKKMTKTLYLEEGSIAGCYDFLLESFFASRSDAGHHLIY